MHCSRLRAHLRARVPAVRVKSASGQCQGSKFLALKDRLSGYPMLPDFSNALMPTIKRLAKLVNKARDLRESHQERHRATGFGFALSASVEYLDPERWDELTVNNSFFLLRRYLRVLEEAGPEKLLQR